MKCGCADGWWLLHSWIPPPSHPTTLPQSTEFVMSHQRTFLTGCVVVLLILVLSCLTFYISIGMRWGSITTTYKWPVELGYPKKNNNKLRFFSRSIIHCFSRAQNISSSVGRRIIQSETKLNMAAPNLNYSLSFRQSGKKIKPRLDIQTGRATRLFNIWRGS